MLQWNLCYCKINFHFNFLFFYKWSLLASVLEQHSLIADYICKRTWPEHTYIFNSLCYWQCINFTTLQWASQVLMKIAKFLTVDMTSLKSMAISHQLQEDRVCFFFLLFHVHLSFWKLYICYICSVFLNCRLCLLCMFHYRI